MSTQRSKLTRDCKKNDMFVNDDSSEDFDSDDSIRDPNYDIKNDNFQNLERRLIQGEISDTDSDSDHDIQTNEAIINDFEFSKTSSVPTKFTQYQFQEKPGPNYDFTTFTPYEIFEQTFGLETLNLIIQQSNIYATQNGKSLNLTIDELKAFLGILVIMGFHNLPSIKLYWSQDSNFKVDRISDVITQKRFLAILRYIHLNDNNQMPKRGELNYDKLYKLRPMIDMLNENFKQLYTPKREISIDESMVGFKGRSSLKQYMPMKPTKRGFKIWVMACTSGYMVSFQVYQGKEEASENTLGERVILQLCRPYMDKGYCLFFDNFFSTLPLINMLLNRQTFACGTFRVNRKNYPKELLKSDKEMKLGDYDFAQSKDVSIVKWRDRGSKCVNVVSSMHNPADITTVKRTNKVGNREEVICPKAIAQYNQNMGGVDKFDQLLSYYSIAWKSRRWWFKIFYYLVDSAIVNAYILYQQTCSTRNVKPLSHLKFRSLLADQLISNYHTRKRRGPVLPLDRKLQKVGGRAVSVESRNRKSNVGDHLPIKGTSRRCTYCSTKEKAKRSQITCRKCEVALCLECFAPFHDA